jgi:hypothetical protein
MNKYYGVTVVENSGMLKTEWATTNFPHAVSSFPEHKYGRDDMHQMYRLIHM